MEPRRRCRQGFHRASGKREGFGREAPEAGGDPCQESGRSQEGHGRRGSAGSSRGRSRSSGRRWREERKRIDRDGIVICSSASCEALFLLDKSLLERSLGPFPPKTGFLGTWKIGPFST